MKKACVFLFSGTGLTKYIIEKMQSEFIKLDVEVDVFSIESTEVQAISFDRYDALGIAYPVHSFNAPKIVIDFARSLPKMERDTFILSSAGEHHPVNFASSNLLISILRKKGYNVFYDRQFNMPANFIVKETESGVLEKIDNVKEEIPVAVHEIIGKNISTRKSSFAVKLLTFAGRAEWYGAKWVKWFYSDKSCNRCGICVAECPNRNIILNESRSSFKWNCGLCMRCIYLCPKHSIKVHRPFRFISIGSWYENEELSVSRSFLQNPASTVVNPAIAESESGVGSVESGVSAVESSVSSGESGVSSAASGAGSGESGDSRVRIRRQQW